MGILELMKVRKIVMEDSEDENNSVHGEGTRFFLNPDAPTDESIDVEADFETPVK
jgi:hypothetical protein